MTLNFIIKLSIFKKPLISTIYNSILIIVNILIKYIYLELYKKVFIVKDLVYIFNKIIIIRYRILNKIVLDRDKLFIL